MNSNGEEFPSSDAWLSEQLFAQLKDFNSEYKDKTALETAGSLLLNDGADILLDEKPQDLSKIRLASFTSTFKQNKLATAPYDISSEVLDLSSSGGAAAMPSGSLIDLNGAGATAVVTSPPSMNDESVSAAATGQFHASADELKLLKFLESQPKQNSLMGFPDQKPYMPSELPSTAYRLFKCSNCNWLFDVISFQSHICDYDEQHNLITANKAPPRLAKVEPRWLLPAEPACIRLLRENQIRIRRFLKEELKYDVHATGNNNDNINNSRGSSNGSQFSNATLGSSSTSQAYPSGQSIGTGSDGFANSFKRQEGPHECSLCERKFVHASGLLRHMEKHAMDLIPKTGNTTTGGKSTAAQGNTATQNVNGLRVVIKCTLCGRIFFEPLVAFKHLCMHFPKSELKEQELDHSGEIPYESYVDTAMSILGADVMCESTMVGYHEEKLYLKIVILSCILQCEFCDLVFSEVSYLFVHSACHVPQRRFECFGCDIYMRTTKEISTHWQAECVFMRENFKVHQATMQRYFVCNVCENKFQSVDQLQEHRYTAYHFFPRLNKRLGVLQLPCEYCDAVFDNAHESVAHYDNKHYKKYRRDKDSAGVSNKTRQYLCDICGKSYTQSSHLWQHLRFHQGVKPFACKEPGCTRKFTIRPDLNDHIRKCHTGERPYHCLVCGKRFLTGSVFYQHRLIHRGERRYECDECGKRFYRADALKNHQRIHTGEKPFGCLFCTKNFRQRGDRDKHTRARHSHLDANARLMMQMQKLQLEAAAAAAAAHQRLGGGNDTIVLPAGVIKEEPIVGDEMDEGSSVSDYGDRYGAASAVSSELVMIGNVAFPKSMFDALVAEADDDALRKQS